LQKVKFSQNFKTGPSQKADRQTEPSFKEDELGLRSNSRSNSQRRKNTPLGAPNRRGTTKISSFLNSLEAKSLLNTSLEAKSSLNPLDTPKPPIYPPLVINIRVWVVPFPQISMKTPLFIKTDARDHFLETLLNFWRPQIEI